MHQSAQSYQPYQRAAQTSQQSRPQSSPQTGNGKKRSGIVAGIGAAIVACAVTVVLHSGSPTAPSVAPVAAPSVASVVTPTTAPAVQAVTDTAPNSCQRERLIEFASVENGGSGVVRFREGNYVSPPITLSSTPQMVVFPSVRADSVFQESIVVEGNATNLVLGADGDHFVVPRVDGSYTYTMKWSPKKC